MGDIDDERRAVATKLQTAWLASAYSSTPIIGENVLGLGESVDNLREGDAPFLELMIQNGRGVRVTLQQSVQRYRHDTIAYVRVNVLRGSGTKDATNMAQVVIDAFRDKQFSYGQSGTISSISEVPYVSSRREEGKWYMFTVAIPLVRDNIKS